MIFTLKWFYVFWFSVLNVLTFKDSALNDSTFHDSMFRDSSLNVMYCPAQLPGRSSVISGSCRLRGTAYVYVWLECTYDPQKANLDSLHTLSWIISYWRLALIFQHSLSAVTRGIYLGGSLISVFRFSALNVLTFKDSALNDSTFHDSMFRDLSLNVM